MVEPAAYVRSVASLERLRHGLCEFQREVLDALAVLELELRRAEEWIGERQPRYWAEAARVADQRLAEARIELERCETTTRPDDRPSCHVQRKAYERARRRLAYCEEQRRVVRRWKTLLDREIRKVRGHLGKLTDVAETQVPRAIASLDRMLEALHNYLAVAQQSTPRSAEMPPAPRLTEGEQLPPSV